MTNTSKGNSNINSIVGFILIGVILFGFSFYNSSTKEDEVKAIQTQDDVKHSKTNNNADPNESTLNHTAPSSSTHDSINPEEKQALNNAYFIFSNAANQKEFLQTISTKKMDVQISNKSGRITNVKLKEFQTNDSNIVELFKKQFSTFYTNITLLTNPEESGSIKSISTENLYFEPSIRSSNINCTSDSVSISYTLMSNDKKRAFIYNYTFFKNKYEVLFSISTKNLTPYISPYSDINLVWEMLTPSQEKSIENQKKTSTIHYKYQNQEPDYLSLGKSKKEVLEASTNWLVFKQQYFSSAIISTNTPFSSEEGFIETFDVPTSASLDYTKGMRASLGIPAKNISKKGFAMKFYFGPNKYNELKNVGEGLENVIDYGWSIFRVVILYFIDPIFEFIFSFGWNIGLVIILLTICVKMILLPLLWKTYVSSAKTKVLKPQLDEINKKHKDDQVKKQQASMQLYRSTGVNPLAGCIPMIIQMPLLFSLFRFFPNKFELRQKSFLWADDLSTYDSIIDLPFNIPFYGSHVSLFALLMAISLIFYTRVNQQLSGGGAPGMDSAMAKNMKVMTYLFPVFSLFFFNSVAAGLSFYYFIANCTTLLQQYVIKKWFIDEEKIKAKIEANKLKPKKKSKFSQKLQERLKEAQKLQEQKKRK